MYNVNMTSVSTYISLYEELALDVSDDVESE